ncbi:hypothetical protein ACIHCQ_01970 [Streptomyces sp. NPDC052236]|uniref:hypothetical protein n=1 Tax=Streptomyces sp. NPDC052236 TaxID=3365686 RepID=UPI0037D0A748
MSCGAAYTGILRWPIAPGRRYRPRGGCTCGDPGTCPAPGAHPLPGPLNPSPAEGLTAELNAAPGAALIAETLPFDAIVLPRWEAMAAMVSLDRFAVVPCLVQESHAVLFVLPATGRYALPGDGCTNVEVRSRPGQWVALPPSHGTRWDTPPWHEQTHQPVPLLHGRDLHEHLTEALGIAVAQRGPDR